MHQRSGQRYSSFPHEPRLSQKERKEVTNEVCMFSQVMVGYLSTSLRYKLFRLQFSILGLNIVLETNDIF